MIIDNNVLAISKCMFQSRNLWVHVTPEQKKAFFFIFNRYFAKKYPEKAFMLNDKLLDEVMGMDLLYAFFGKEGYPKWFWSKSEKKAEKDTKIEEKYLIKLKQKYDINTDEEMEILKDYYADDIKEEIKYYKSLEKE